MSGAWAGRIEGWAEHPMPGLSVWLGLPHSIRISGQAPLEKPQKWVFRRPRQNRNGLFVTWHRKSRGITLPLLLYWAKVSPAHPDSSSGHRDFARGVKAFVVCLTTTTASVRTRSRSMAAKSRLTIIRLVGALGKMLEDLMMGKSDFKIWILNLLDIRQTVVPLWGLFSLSIKWRKSYSNLVATMKSNEAPEKPRQSRCFLNRNY